MISKNEARIGSLLELLGELLDHHDIEGIGVVLVDGRHEVRTMYSFNEGVRYEMVAGAHLLDRRLVAVSVAEGGLMDLKPAGTA